MERKIEFAQFSGAERADGSVIGFDYGRQMWIDTSLRAQRDPATEPGSACNPLPSFAGVGANWNTI